MDLDRVVQNKDTLESADIQLEIEQYQYDQSRLFLNFKCIPKNETKRCKDHKINVKNET